MLNSYDGVRIAVREPENRINEVGKWYLLGESRGHKGIQDSNQREELQYLRLFMWSNPEQ
jgi:hypothetical protein